MESYITSDNIKYFRKKWKKEGKVTKGMSALQYICYLYPEFKKQLENTKLNK